MLYSRTFLFIHPVIIIYICYPQTGFPGGSMTKNPPAMQETWVQSRGQEELATHSSILTWEMLWTEEPERLQSIRLQSQTRLSTQTPQPSNFSILPTPSSNKGWSPFQTDLNTQLRMLLFMGSQKSQTWLSDLTATIPKLPILPSPPPPLATTSLFSVSVSL